MAEPEYVSIQELESAEIQIIKMIQQHRFAQEIKELRRNRCVLNNSSLITLNPFLDDNGLIRVGGRMKAAGVTYNQQHPIILPTKCNVTYLIAIEQHRKNLQPTRTALRYETQILANPWQTIVTSSSTALHYLLQE